MEIVAPSLLQPLPKHTLLDLLMDKSRVAIVEESPVGPGFGSELAAILLEHRFAGACQTIWLRRRSPFPRPGVSNRQSSPTNAALRCAGRPSSPTIAR